MNKIFLSTLVFSLAAITARANHLDPSSVAKVYIDSNGRSFAAADTASPISVERFGGPETPKNNETQLQFDSTASTDPNHPGYYEIDLRFKNSADADYFDKLIKDPSLEVHIDSRYLDSDEFVKAKDLWIKVVGTNSSQMRFTDMAKDKLGSRLGLLISGYAEMNHDRHQ